MYLLFIWCGTYLGPNGTSLLIAISWPKKKKTQFSGPTPLKEPRNRFATINIKKSKHLIKKQVHGNFIYMSFCCSCILYSLPYKYVVSFMYMSFAAAV